jgi:hypothetical protein
LQAALKFNVPILEDQGNRGAQADTPQADKTRKLLGIDPVEIQHELTCNGKSLPSLSRAGVLPLKDAFGS